MTELNQYALSKILGSKMKPIKEAEFGNFSLLETTAEVLRSREINAGLIRSSSGFTYDDDRVVCRAFEDVRDGASTDALLWDRALLHRFLKRCQEHGLDAPDAMLSRRVINIRKNKTRYQKHGIVLSPTTKKEPKPSIVSEYAHVIEFALVRLRYRYGVSIDDILLDTDLSDQYEKFAQQIAPGLSDEDLRLGALYIRKTRFVKKKDQLDIQLLDLHAIEKKWSKTICLSQIDPKDVPESPGLLEIKERDRYLYISRNEKLRSTVEQFVNGQAFKIVAGAFWKPDTHLITLQFIKGEKVIGVSTRKWENRLIHDFRPVFNWPVNKMAA